MPSFARPAIVLPIILIANLAFASYFLDLTLNPFAFSAPQPYRNLIFIVLFYACTLTLSLYLSQWPNVLSAKEKDALEAYIFSAETALALVWWFAVLILTPADGEKDVDWTSARVGILAGSSVFGFVGCGMICVVLGQVGNPEPTSKRTADAREAAKAKEAAVLPPTTGDEKDKDE